MIQADKNPVLDILIKSRSAPDETLMVLLNLTTRKFALFKIVTSGYVILKEVCLYLNRKIMKSKGMDNGSLTIHRRSNH